MKEHIKQGIYEAFVCTADKCTLSCCQEWRIAVDEPTLKKWQHMSQTEGKDLPLLESVEKDTSGYRMKLNQDKCCPLLDCHKLCQVVTQVGDAYLSETCATFPRVIKASKTHEEYSLDTGCPAVIDLLQGVGKQSFDVPNTCEKTPIHRIREATIALLQDTDYTLPQRLLIGFYNLLELNDKAVCTPEIIAAYFDKGQASELIKCFKTMRFHEMDTLTESNELFLDSVDNYRKQGLYKSWLEPLAQCAEKLEKTYTEDALKEKVVQFRKELKAYEPLLTQYLVAEVITNMADEDTTCLTSIITFEWLGLVYAVVRQTLFLKWLVDGEQALGYDDVRDYLAVLARVTGYERNDRIAYLENSFEELVWEWGYFALIIGNKTL